MAWMPGESFCVRVWESIERFAIGVASPLQIRRTGRARAEVRREEALLEAQTKREIEAIISGSTASSLLASPQLRLSAPPSKGGLRLEPTVGLPVPQAAVELAELARLRATTDEIEKLTNIRAVHRLAEEVAEEDYAEQQPPEARASKDWLMAWRAGAELVEEEDLQRLWARLLCDEIAAPGAFSKRAIDALRTLSSREAKLLSMVGPYVLDGMIPKLKVKGNVIRTGELDLEGVSLGDLFELQAAGLVIDAGGALSRTLRAHKRTDGKFTFLLSTFGSAKVALTYDKDFEVSIHAIPVSPVGLQLLKLGRFSLDDAMPLRIARFIEKEHSAIPDQFGLAEIVANGEMREIRFSKTFDYESSESNTDHTPGG